MKINLLIFIGLALMIGAGCNTAGRKENKPDHNRLVGEWVRTDGVYKLKILTATADGKLDAGYFNPDPIHVGQADWLVKDKNIIVTVVLQDVNYPGSTYTLQYFPTTDRLAGNYYQAVEQTNYGVEFTRQK